MGLDVAAAVRSPRRSARRSSSSGASSSRARARRWSISACSSHRPILLTNVATLISGFALFSCFVLLPAFVETDARARLRLRRQRDEGGSLPAAELAWRCSFAGPLAGSDRATASARSGRSRGGMLVVSFAALLFAGRPRRPVARPRRQRAARARRRRRLRVDGRADRRQRRRARDGRRRWDEHRRPHDRRGDRRPGRRQPSSPRRRSARARSPPSPRSRPPSRSARSRRSSPAASPSRSARSRSAGASSPCTRARANVPVVDADAVEIRVLGCLIEKQRTTPDQYPLSLNALRLACNQATNRDPVVDYDEATIRAAIDKLSRRGWVRLASGPGGRVAKYRHLLDDALGRVPSQIALLGGADAPRRADARRAEEPGRAALSVRLARGRPAGARRCSPSTSSSRSCRAGPARARTATSSCSAAATAGGEPAGEPERSTNVESVESTQSPLEQRVARLEEQVAELQRALEER